MIDDSDGDVKLSEMRGATEPTAVYRKRGERFTTEPDVRHETMHPPRSLRPVTEADAQTELLSKILRRVRTLELMFSGSGTKESPGVFNMVEKVFEASARMESMHRQTQAALWLIAGAWTLVAVSLFSYVAYVMPK